METEASRGAQLASMTACRGAHLRFLPVQSFEQTVREALETQMFLVQETGPTSFVIKQDGSDAKFKVSSFALLCWGLARCNSGPSGPVTLPGQVNIGLTMSCSCRKKDAACKHLVRFLAAPRPALPSFHGWCRSFS